MKTRIVRFERHGGPEVLKIFHEEKKQPKELEVAIKIIAFGVNQGEVMYREGRYVSHPNFPARLGSEGSGIIESLGSNEQEWKIGDEVTIIPFLSYDKNGYWTSDSSNKYGTYGDTAIVPSWTISKKQHNQSFEESSSIWAQYLTAWGGLVHDVDINKRKFCIFTGASSNAAIGGMQIVKYFGLKALAISRTLNKKNELKKIGYDEVLALDDPNLEEQIMDYTNGIGFDLAYDCVGGEHFTKLINAAKPQALIVNYGNLNLNASKIKTLPLLSKRIHIRFHSIFDTMRFEDQRKQGIEWINNKIEKGILRPVIAKIFDLENIVDAHKYLESAKHIGKVVVKT